MAYTPDNPIVVADHQTEQTAYEPQTYNDLLAAMETATIYVKLTKDFDFSKSDQYKYSIPSPIQFACTKLFADNKNASGEKYQINGINCGNNNYFMGLNAYAYMTISNIDLINIVYKPSGSGALINGGGNGVKLTFSDCRLSFLIITPSVVPQIDSPTQINVLEFVRTSMYYKFIQTTNSAYSAAYNLFCSKRDYCTVQFTGLKAHRDNSGFNRAIVQNSTYSTYYGDISIVDEIGNFTIIQSSASCCIAVNFIQMPTSTAPSTMIVQTSLMSGVSIMDSEMSDMQSLITYSSDSNVIKLTTSEMKDEDKLIEIGFLP
jgi:hypothetical protein